MEGDAGAWAIIDATDNGRMALARKFFSMVALLCSCAAAAQALPAEVDAALAAAKIPRDAVSLLVVDAEGRGAPRLSHRANVALNPASVMKLVTTSAALDMLGPSFVWTTPVYLDGPVRDGVLQGNLVIKGQGDPTLVIERLWLLLRRVRALGIQTISGDIVLDRSAFETVPQDPGDFDGERLRPYNAAPDALLLNFKSVVMTFTPGAASTSVSYDPPLAGVQMQASVPQLAGECGDYRARLRADFADPARIRFSGSYPASCGEKVWPLAYADPASYAVRAVQAMWQEIGGKLVGTVREGQLSAGLKPAFEISSPSLAEVVRGINKSSHNVMAQQVFRTLSLQQKGVGTLQGSRELVLAWWRERFSEQDLPVLDNGSGLSRRERITAQGLARLLQAVYLSPLMPELMSSLPIAGVDGTLKRSKLRTAGGSAHLKTGTLRDASAMAGYVHGISGRRYVMVAMANHPNAAAARAAFDALLEWTYRDDK
jgi:D-alanyl-D-alanine carboxypeptidase/D-alanyl-D-alanine-endopeptidase (penicillin-binding protein 4)